MALAGSVQLGLGQKAPVRGCRLRAREVIPLLTPFQPSQDLKLQLQYNVLVSLISKHQPDSQTQPIYLHLQGNVSPLVQCTALNLFFVEMYFFLSGKINCYHHLLHFFLHA